MIVSIWRSLLALAMLVAWTAPCVAQTPGEAEVTKSNSDLITLNAAKTEIADALRMVAAQGGLNLVIGKDVEGQVSVYIEGLPVRTALRAVAESNGFVYEERDGLIAISRPVQRDRDAEVVAPVLETRVFNLQWQDAQRVKDALEFALTSYGKISVLNENSLQPYGGTKLSELSGDLDSGATGSAYRPTTGAGGGTTGGPSDPSQLPQNSRTLVVTDTADSLTHVADLIADLDRVPPQVLVEARIVEMTTDLQRQLGIDWDINVLANGPVLNHELPLNGRAGFSGGSQIRYSPDGTANTANPLALGTIDFSRFTALLRVHQQENAIRLLANPRLLVFNNHSASILVGERYPILEANITDQGTLTEAFDTYIPVGVQLEVTPSIMADGRVSMLVHPATSSLGDNVVGTTGLEVRRILTREIDTRVLMHDGQTIVLGGLLTDRKTRTINKIPGLGDVPILNFLFRQESPQSNRVDLLVFLTVHVEGAEVISERDREVFDTYKPNFKQIEKLQDLPLHFEIPSEYNEPPKPMFGDPVSDEEVASEEATPDDLAHRRTNDTRAVHPGFVVTSSSSNGATAAGTEKTASAAEVE